MTNHPNPIPPAAAIGRLLAGKWTAEPTTPQRAINGTLTTLAEEIEQLLPGTWSAFTAEVVRTCE